VLTAVALAGCGGSSSPGHTRTAAGATIPVYGAFGQTPIRAPAKIDPRSKACRVDASAALDSVRLYLAHSGAQAAYPADLYYMSIRDALTDFQVRRCDLALIGSPLRRRLTAKQRAALVSSLPTIYARVIARALAGAGST
jgi:hypothetical protein